MVKERRNLYDLIPDGGNGCNSDLLYLNSVTSDLNELLAGIEINTLDELNAAASEFLYYYNSNIFI